MGFLKDVLDFFKSRFVAPTIPPPEVSDDDRKQALFLLLNEERLLRDLPPFIRDPRLDVSAQRHADFMAKFDRIDHRLPGENAFGCRITAAGYRWSAAAENVAVGHATPEQVVASWMNEDAILDGHRKSILGPYVNVGCGMASNPRSVWTWYWTVDFATEIKNPS